jgi:hypothetical protein
MGGAKEREDGCTNPFVLIPPSVSRPHSPPQDLVESAGPSGRVSLALRQQHFARLRQQDEADGLNERAASGTREANDRSTARHAAVMPRTQRKLSPLPSILWYRSISHTLRT